MLLFSCRVASSAVKRFENIFCCCGKQRNGGDVLVFQLCASSRRDGRHLFLFLFCLFEIGTLIRYLNQIYLKIVFQSNWPRFHDCDRKHSAQAAERQVNVIKKRATVWHTQDVTSKSSATMQLSFFPEAFFLSECAACQTHTN